MPGSNIHIPKKNTSCFRSLAINHNAFSIEEMFLEKVRELQSYPHIYLPGGGGGGVAVAY